MPLFLLRSAIVRRLWLDTRLLLASFLRRSSVVSRVCPWPFGLPTTLPGRSGLKLEEKKEEEVNRGTGQGHQVNLPGTARFHVFSQIFRSPMNLFEKKLTHNSSGA